MLALSPESLLALSAVALSAVLLLAVLVFGWWHPAEGPELPVRSLEDADR